MKKTTDIHQQTADELGIDRKRAKIINYMRHYGVRGNFGYLDAGVKNLYNHIKRGFDPR